MRVIPASLEEVLRKAQEAREAGKLSPEQTSALKELNFGMMYGSKGTALNRVMSSPNIQQIFKGDPNVPIVAHHHPRPPMMCVHHHNFSHIEAMVAAQELARKRLLEKKDRLIKAVKKRFGRRVRVYEIHDSLSFEVPGLTKEEEKELQLMILEEL